MWKKEIKEYIVTLVFYSLTNLKKTRSLVRFAGVWHVVFDGYHIFSLNTDYDDGFRAVNTKKLISDVYKIRVKTSWLYCYHNDLQIVKLTLIVY